MLESRKGASMRIPHWRLVIDHAGITPEVANYDYEGSGTEDDPYIVRWIPDDPRNPMNFSEFRKWAITGVVAWVTLAVALVSSAYSGGVAEIMTTFHISQLVAILGVSLFVLGFAVGPLLWAPFSELFGRQIMFFLTYGALTAFNAGCAGAQNATTLLVLRFFAGAFGSSPLTNAGGVVADMFPASQRGTAMAVFASAPFLGPTLGPIIGGFLGLGGGWRWVMGFLAAFSGALWIIGSILLPETYAPVLLRKRAAKLSQMTGKHYLSVVDRDQGRVSLGESFRVALSRPWILLFREPIVFLLSLYMAIIYGTLYMLFAAFPIVYQENRGWSAGIGGLAFLGILVGMLIAIAYTFYDNGRYIRVQAQHGGFAPPEARLLPTMIGSIFIPIGLFWFAWTNYPEIHWMASITAGVPFGFGMVLVFLSVMNYLVDAYTIFAASVLAANSVLRSLFGAAFPLFTTYMYKNLGIHWASSIPAFLALGCVPFPFLFYKYGAAIRERCKYAAQSAEFMAKLQDEQVSSGREESVEEKEDIEEIQTDARTASFGESDSEIVQTMSITRHRRSNSFATSDGHHALSQSNSRTYEGNPYDIDRVNTRETFSHK
ncbi:MFS general substrate transporter [Jackrogersella minutella]|nr:MFS general substrate transporter [Jackrogersella minutella]